MKSTLSREELPIGIDLLSTDAESSWNEVSDEPPRFKRLHCSDPWYRDRVVKFLEEIVSRDLKKTWNIRYFTFRNLKDFLIYHFKNQV